MHKQPLAGLITVLILIPALLCSCGEKLSEQSPATKLPAAFGPIQPRLSPDGGTVAFTYQGEIWTGPVAGGTMTLLAPSQGGDGEPAWSPDGRRIAYLRDGSVRVAQFPDGADVPLAKSATVGGTYAWNKLEFASSGKKLLGAFRIPGQANSMAWLDLDSGELTPLLAASSYSRFALQPHDQWIAYTTMPDQPGEQSGSDGSHTELWKMPVAGGPPQKLCRFPARIHDLCWANEKSLILATELGQAHDDLWQLPLDDPLRGMHKLTSGQADEDRPSVSRDGRRFVYTDNRAGPTTLMLRELRTGSENAIRFDAADFRRPAGTLRLKVIDKESGKPAVARLSLREDNGRFHAPPGSLHRSLRGRGHFYCDQTAELTVPAGKYHLRGYRGPEYKVTSHEFSVEAGQSRELTVELERWIHLAMDGWHSGELHIHANYGYGNWFNTPETMRQQCVGEDLNVCNFMVANSDADVVFDRPFFRGGPDPLSTPTNILYWNQEFRSTVWGHMTLVNLKQLVEPVFTGFQGTTNPWDTPSNADIADRTHWQQGVVNYTHVSQAEDWSKTPYAAKSIPIDVALGKIDTLDINNSWAASVPLWYRLLNCGFRVPATAGTDVFLNRIGSNLPGGDRVYVHCGNPLSYERWIEGLKAGRSFVTNEPMLTFSVNGEAPGAVLKLGEMPKVRVKATARSQFPLTKAELVHNGKVVATAVLTADNLSATLNQEVALESGGWLAFRADGRGTPDTPLSTLNAHTNPVYVEAGGVRYRSAEEARGFLTWIDQFETLLRARNRFPNQQLRDQALEQLAAAKKVYVEIARGTAK